MLDIKKRYRVKAICVFAGNPYLIGEMIESLESDEIRHLIEVGAVSEIATDKTRAENKASTGPEQNKANG